MSKDLKTAEAFAKSWTNLPAGSVYTREQFRDWMAPLGRSDVENRRVLELGCGNGSLLVHLADWKPRSIRGVELGESADVATQNLSRAGFKNFKIVRADLTEFNSSGFDIVFCIGVLHHLKEPRSGFEAVIRNTKPGGRFHCWVYAMEGNEIIRAAVEPLRKICSRMPWWFTKHVVATTLVVPYYFYARLIRKHRNRLPVKKLPLYAYSLWISRREFSFFRHVAFDQLVTPQTTYIPKTTIAHWLRSFPEIDPDSIYTIFRNGNSWKFGGKIRS